MGVDDLCQILDSEEMTVHYLGCLGRASISTGSTLPLIVSAQVLLLWRSKNLCCRKDSDQTLQQENQEEEEEKIEKVEVLESVEEGKSTTGEPEGNSTTGEPEGNSTTEEPPAKENQLPKACVEDVHIIIEMLKSLSLYVNSTNQESKKKRKKKGASDEKSNMLNSIEEYLMRSDSSLNSAALESISALCGYHRGLVACALRATRRW